MRKYNTGDLVKFNKDYNGKNGMMAVVEYTYLSKYGCGSSDDISLMFEDGSSSSWWHPNDLEFIESNKMVLCEKWKSDRKERDTMNSDLDWIFENIDHVLSKRLTASYQAIHTYLGFGSLWGSNGEGFVLQHNILSIEFILKMFIDSGEDLNKESFKDFFNKLSK